MFIFNKTAVFLTLYSKLHKLIIFYFPFFRSLFTWLLYMSREFDLCFSRAKPNISLFYRWAFSNSFFHITFIFCFIVWLLSFPFWVFVTLRVIIWLFSFLNYFFSIFFIFSVLITISFHLISLSIFLVIISCTQFNPHESSFILWFM